MPARNYLVEILVNAAIGLAMIGVLFGRAWARMAAKWMKRRRSHDRGGRDDAAD